MFTYSQNSAIVQTQLDYIFFKTFDPTSGREIPRKFDDAFWSDLADKESQRAADFRRLMMWNKVGIILVASIIMLPALLLR